jgi:ATP-dependent Zn protease
MGGMGGGGAGAGTLQALLSELQGLKKPRGFMNRVVRRALGMRPKQPPKYRILVMMATNMPDSLDPALLRPGRIDRIYRVGYPSKEGRKRTYQGYLDKVTHNLTDEDIDRLSISTPYATGATIKDLVNEALISAISRNSENITWKDIIHAKHLKDLGPSEGVVYTGREQHSVAIHEACHAVTAYIKRKHLSIDVATIEKGSDYLGMVSSIPFEEMFSSWSSHYETDISVSIASLVGERLFFDGDSTSGVSGDLDSATKIALFMESRWGMGETISSGSVLGDSSLPQSSEKKNSSTEIYSQRVEKRLLAIYKETENLLNAEKDAILSVAHALEVHKTITGIDVEAIILKKQGHIVDGSIYNNKEFVDLLHSYHNEVLLAHKEHRDVSIKLPLTPDLHIENYTKSNNTITSDPAWSEPDDN